MSELMLIRHGQARFASRDYDRLSAIGRRQARLIGRHLAADGRPFDAWISGSMRRQRATAELAGHQFGTPPALVVDTAFDEYDFDSVFAAYGARLAETHPDLAPDADARSFQKAFEIVMGYWIADTPPDAPLAERWPAFRARVAGALRHLHGAQPRDARIAVFTSGGPIAVALGAALMASATTTLGLNWAIHNGAITRLRSTRDGWRLTGFNDTAALAAAGDPALITFR